MLCSAMVQGPNLPALAAAQRCGQIMGFEGGIQQQKMVLKAIITAAFLQPGLQLVLALHCWSETLNANDGP